MEIVAWVLVGATDKTMLAKLKLGAGIRVMNPSKFEHFLLRHDLKPFLQTPFIKEIENFVLRAAA